MSVTIVMPALGESVSEGTVTRWLKTVGDAVELGEPLVEVSTDKVDTEVVATAAGVIESLLVQIDETVDIGTPIATLTVATSDLAEGDSTANAAPASADPAVNAPPAPREGPAASSSEAAPPAPRSDGSTRRPYYSPLVRRLLADHVIDPSVVVGTGVGGRVRRDDVLALVRAQDAGVASGSGGTLVPLSRLRRVIAAKAVESMMSTAQLTTVVEVDVTRVDRLRQAHKESFRLRTGIGLSFLPFFAVAATQALRQHPIINARIDGDNLVYPAAEHVGFAVDTEKGLYSPVVHDASKLGIEEFARAIDDLASRAREGRLAPDDLTGATFTITNTGSRGALFDTPVVFLPQVAILGTGVVTRRPVVLSRAGEDFIAVRSMVYLALSYDHRAVDGADAARYLKVVKDRLEAGEFTVE
jgi:2-oxoglutarate dehydrogenase E2 component (dihydrolipoamide succinyltransferase)